MRKFFLGLVAVSVALWNLGSAVQAQHFLPWRTQISKRLDDQAAAIAALIANQRQAPAPAPTPLPYMGPAPIIVQPPLQLLPIQGEPRQLLPIQGEPRQLLPIPGDPKLPLPIDGTPKQPLPQDGAPKQQLPVMPPATGSGPQAYSIRRALFVPLLP